METFSQYITKDDNDLIRIAAFIADKGTKGLLYKDFYEFLCEINLLNDCEKDQLIKSEVPFGHDDSINKETSEKISSLFSQLDLGSSFDTRNGKISITFDGISSLLDFIELKQARKNSKDAKIYSLIAIYISAIALILTCVFGVYQLNSVVKIDKQQFNKIEEINSALLISNQNLFLQNMHLDSIDNQFKLSGKRDKTPKK
jgi:hypothetical protein